MRRARALVSIALTGLIAGAAALPPHRSPSPAPIEKPRDEISWEPSAFSAFLDNRSVDPDTRIFLASTELQRINRLAELESKKPYHFVIPHVRFKVRKALFRPAVALAASQAENQQIVEAISQWRGLDPTFMTHLAVRESSLDNMAHAHTSSGVGLYQFTENTWLCALLDHGRQYQIVGVERIYRSAKGDCRVDDPEVRSALLALRFDGVTNAKIGADHTIDNFTILQDYLGRPPDGTEVYLLHFFGETEGKSFIAAYLRSPNASGPSLFPRAAASNYSIFYHKDGTPRRLYEIYDNFSRTFTARQG